jgi:hypothetical protein
MRDMSHLLALAAWWCGDRARAIVFEPLLADWQYELDAARHAGRARHAIAIASGLFAYARSFIRCTLTTSGWLPTSRAAQIVALTFFCTFDAALFLLWMAALPSGRTLDLGSIQTRAFLLAVAPLAFAPILLPALFLMRRDPRSTVRHAVSVIVVGAVLTAGVVWLRSPENLNWYFSSFEAYEGEYQRNLANDRAGRVTYPATAVRQLRGPTTIEERRAEYERFMAVRSAQQQPRPLSRSQQLRRYQPVALAILFGMMGWTLAGLGPVSFTRAAGWWLLMYAALLAFGGMPRTISGLAAPVLPNAYAIPAFGAMTMALISTSWRRHPGTPDS